MSLERMNLERELAEEQDRYQMLNQTLVGQPKSARAKGVYESALRVLAAARN